MLLLAAFLFVLNITFFFRIFENIPKREFVAKCRNVPQVSLYVYVYTYLRAENTLRYIAYVCFA